MARKESYAELKAQNKKLSNDIQMLSEHNEVQAEIIAELEAQLEDKSEEISLLKDAIELVERVYKFYYVVTSSERGDSKKKVLDVDMDDVLRRF